MSFYADYLKERTNDEIIETGFGFATYRFLDEKTCYIVDIYIVPACRKEGRASDIADIIKEIARERGCKELLGSVVPSAKGSTTSVKVLLAYGMTLKSCEKDFILFGKEL